ncbi:MAG: TonB-dependent receptor [Sphingobacteriia bacterium]
MRKKLLLSFCAFLLASLTLLAQNTTVTGKVTDAQTGAPLPGVTISLNGKGLGVTKADGTYSVAVPSTAKKLTLSYVGFDDQQISVGAASQNVQLVPGDKSLNEVVVTGYQALQKRQVTGAISTVKSEAFKNTPIGSFDQMLQGQASGALIQANSGQPGAAARVIIRGVGSVNGTTEPLYILDGIQISAQNFQSINPNDFESISLLKDASTTAQYGSRGANGVIVITSKQGKLGKTKFEYNAQYGQSRFPENKLEVMNTNQKLDYEIARGNPYGWTATQLDSLRRINTNWMDEITQTGITNNHQLSASGGNEKTTFYVSGALFNQTGTVQKTGLKRYSGRMNLTHNASQNVKFGVNSYVGWSNYENTTESNTTISSPLNAIRWANPYERPFTPTGAYQQFVSGQPNAVQDMNETNRGTKELKIVASTFLEAKLPFILKGLSFRTQWGVDYENWDQTTLFTRFSVAGQAQTGNNGVYAKTSRTQTRYTGTTSLNYAKKLGDHDFSVGVYNEFVNTIFNRFNYSGFGLTGNFQNGAGITNGSATFIPTVGENRTENAIISFFGIGSYSFKNKYFLNASVRRDGSSRFGSSNRFATFYTVGAGWMISDEDFFKNIRFVETLKLSTSYGTVGNQEGIGDFASRELFVPRTYVGIAGPGISQLPNQELTWEERQKFNIGLNATFLKGRITFNVDFYNDITNRLFLNNQLSRTTGFNSLNTNIGKVQNRGFEFTLVTENIRTKDFRWTTNLNFTINRNKVLELTPTTPAIGVVGGTTVQQVGAPLNSNFLVKYEGVNPANGNAIYRRPNGVLTELYDDVNDRQLFGTRDAPYFGGFTNKFTYKGIELNVFFSYSFGNLVYNNDRANVENPSYFGDNMWVEVAKEWRKPGDITSIPRANQTMRTATTRFIEDGSFLRLRNIQLAYNLPNTVAKSLRISSARFFLMGENLWTGTKFLGFDPELSNGALTGAQYPALRTLTVGLSVGF